MNINYKDLSYILSALKFYKEGLGQVEEDDEDVSEDQFSDIQDDIMYLEGLIHLVQKQMHEEESAAPSLSVVTSPSDKD